MSQWYVKELSLLTRVSVRTLHHYDRIGLLKPSLRLDNGYRVYSEVDLLKLQRIIALKFFGFSLNDIKLLLKNEKDALQPLTQKVLFLQEKAEALLNARDVLQKIIAAVDDNLEIPWQKAIEMIGVYQMIEEENESWAKTVLSETELKQYADQDANSDAALPEWQQLVEECAHDVATEEALFQAALQDDRISTVAKTWLRKVHNRR